MTSHPYEFLVQKQQFLHSQILYLEKFDANKGINFIRSNQYHFFSTPGTPSVKDPVARGFFTSIFYRN